MRRGRSDFCPLRVVVVGLAVLLVTSFWQGGHGSWAQGMATVRVESPVVEMPPGETATVSILVEDVTGLYCFEFKLGFDPTKIEVVDADTDAPGVQIADGDFLSTDWKLQNEVDNQQGRIAYALCQLNPSEPQSGSGVLATITWRAKEPGTSSVDLHDVILSAPLGVEIPVEVQDGEIVVSGQPGLAGTATQPPTPTRTSTASPPSATPTVAAASTTPLPTSTEQAQASPGAGEAATATASPTASGAQTPTALDVTLAPTATATAGGVAATTSTSQPEPSATVSPAETPVATSMEIPTRTETMSEVSGTSETASSDATPMPTEGARQSQSSRSGFFGLPSPVLVVVAVGCLALGVGAFILASTLWKRSKENNESQEAE